MFRLAIANKVSLPKIFEFNLKPKGKGSSFEGKV